MINNFFIYRTPLNCLGYQETDEKSYLIKVMVPLR